MKSEIRKFLMMVFPVEFPPEMDASKICRNPNDEEALANVKCLEGVSWIHLDSDFWFGVDDVLTDLSPAASVYYLPSIIASSFEDQKTMEYTIISLLNEWAGMDATENECRDERWKNLSEFQKGFVTMWIATLGDNTFDGEPNELVLNSIGYFAPNSRAPHTSLE